MYNDASFVMGNIEFDRNQINAAADGMYFYDFKNWGRYMYGNSTFIMGNFTVNDNVIGCDDGIYLNDLCALGCQMYNDSSFAMENIEFNNNRINPDGDGIYLHGYDLGTSLYDNALATFGNFLIQSNIIAGGHHGISLFTDNVTISDNEINENDHGIWVDSGYNEIVRNMIVDNSGATGVHATANSSDNGIRENCFIDNVPQALDNGTGNDWDGNYWSPPPGGTGNYNIAGSAASEDTNPLDVCPLGESPISAPAPVPALTPPGMMLMIGLLAVAGFVTLRRRE
jgi:parallel beta-helix repeat protein